MPNLNHDADPTPTPAPKDRLGKAYEAASSLPANVAKFADPTGATSIGAGAIELAEGARRVADGRTREAVAPLAHGTVDLVSGIPLAGKLASGAKLAATAGRGLEAARATEPAMKFLGSVAPAATKLIADRISTSPSPEGKVDLGSMRDKIREDLFKADVRARELRGQDASPK